MALRAVVFDVGETLVDEERWWRRLSDREGLQPHVVWAALGVTIARGEEHDAGVFFVDPRAREEQEVGAREHAPRLPREEVPIETDRERDLETADHDER